MNTVPEVGMPPVCCGLALRERGREVLVNTHDSQGASASPAEDRVDDLASLVRSRLERQHGLTDTAHPWERGEPSATGSSPSSLQVGDRRADHDAAEQPSAFDTNGTVRLARGFASMT